MAGGIPGGRAPGGGTGGGKEPGGGMPIGEMEKELAIVRSNLSLQRACSSLASPGRRALSPSS